MPSQLGQDHFVLELLNGKRHGYFLDSGASDGVRVSNTVLLERAFGWRGICVEPNDAFYAALIKNRRCCCINACLADREGEVAFVEAAGTLGGILDDYEPRLLRQAMAAFGLQPESDGRPPTVWKRTMTIRSVLRMCQAPPMIDYWSLDTEGSELRLLRSFPFDEYSFRVLTVEHNRFPVRDEIRRFLESRGYLFAASLGIDDGYVLNEGRGPSLWRSRAFRMGPQRRLT
jgi:Methyltransferase FkbM domain